MNNYETLLDKACKEGLIIKEKPLKYNDGRIKGNRVAIRKDIPTTNEKACVLAEELGHHHTSIGNILDVSLMENAKQERQSRLWAYNSQIGLQGIINAYENGCQNRHDTAVYLEVTEEFLQECIECYRNKYGVMTTVDNYCIIFIPHLVVGKIME